MSTPRAKPGADPESRGKPGADPESRAREASCSCGQLRVLVSGPVRRVSICHCLACQRRTGSPFGEQARFDASSTEIHGRASEYVRRADEDGEERTFHFCPECGATVFYRNEREPGMIAIPVGAFADPGFPAPVRSVWGERKHDWVVLPDSIETFD
jgi:hypothetical protein